MFQPRTFPATFLNGWLYNHWTRLAFLYVLFRYHLPLEIMQCGKSWKTMLTLHKRLKNDWTSAGQSACPLISTTSTPGKLPSSWMPSSASWPRIFNNNSSSQHQPCIRKCFAKHDCSPGGHKGTLMTTENKEQIRCKCCCCVDAHNKNNAAMNKGSKTASAT